MLFLFFSSQGGNGYWRERFLTAPQAERRTNCSVDFTIKIRFNLYSANATLLKTLIVVVLNVTKLTTIKPPKEEINSVMYVRFDHILSGDQVFG